MPDSLGRNYQFNAGFAPALLNGHSARLFKADGWIDLRILAVGALPSFRWDVGALTAGSTTAAQDPTHLDMPVGEFSQVRSIIRGQFELELTHPNQSVRQWQSKSNGWRLTPVDWDQDPAASAFMWAASELWIFEDETPRFDFIALSSAQVLNGHVDHYGWRYSYEVFTDEESNKNPPKANIWVNSWPSGITSR